MDAQWMSLSRIILALAIAVIVASAQSGFAQSDFSERTIPPSAPAPRPVRPRPAPATRLAPVDPEAADEPAEDAPPKPIAKPVPAGMIPYTVRPGDTLGTIAQMFGITPDDLAKANRLHPDSELMADAVLKVPKPFAAEVSTLKNQVESLNAQSQAAQQKADAAEEQVKTLQAQTQELTGDNQELQRGLKLLPWWRATAVSIGIAALIMFGVMALTLFEWWRMRRRFVALAEMTDALSRLDHKYKAMLAKAELRLQQLYGRRRQGITEGQPRPKMPEEIEIERLNEELKEILQLHLQRMGARLQGSRRRKGWREMFGGGDVSSAVEARSARR
ncbi:MAG: LysM peptidoglycan-binding domain-containing protein [Candidatus Binatus sp.]|uniref:LysM peptidoglycan-binding domain-containing protein n=1 Tax=Candidatus Binatus sp. TaxID=2811406 RepID=UPI002725BB00|nr:LysM peptidoglycan-binding domain-containing protein [Candidatus Binatus sp.]MDO8432899.1 LysM peptidoglycan-binding domain-containing protein [Candidatus Binatus sp.]